MKLLKYLSKCGVPEDANKFRAIDVKLVSESTKNRKLVESITKKYSLDEDIVSLLDSLNKELKRFYRGKYKFDFVFNEGKDINEVKIKNSKRIKTKFFEFNDELASIKRKFENKLKEENLS
jgi:hypothetical protein